MPKPPKSRSVTASQAISYLAKAEEFLAAAESELGAERGIAATSLAIHAAINAADAVCGIRIGRRSSGSDHDQVRRLLAEAGADGRDLDKELRRLLPLKSRAEYDAGDVPTSVAARAVERAGRCVAVARRVVSAAQ